MCVVLRNKTQCEAEGTHESSDVFFLGFTDTDKTLKYFLLIYRLCSHQICVTEMNIKLDFSHQPSKISGNRMLCADEYILLLMREREGEG